MKPKKFPISPGTIGNIIFSPVSSFFGDLVLFIRSITASATTRTPAHVSVAVGINCCSSSIKPSQSEILQKLLHVIFDQMTLQFNGVNQLTTFIRP